MTHAHDALVATATGQLGSISREQANALGLTDHQLRSRVKSGFLEKIGPNAFRLAGTGLTPESRLVGVMLDVGEPCWVAGPTAAALYRLDGFELGAPFHLVTPRGRQVRRAGVVIHSSEYLPERDLGAVRNIRTIRPTRTIIDLARMVDRSALTRALDSAVRDRLTSEIALLRRIARLNGPNHSRLGIDALIEVIEGCEISRGGHSYLEREFMRLLDERGMPRPDPQRVLARAGDHMVRVDFRFPGSRVVVELLGYRYHRTPSQLDRDSTRLNALIADGYTPYQFSYRQVMTEPDHVVQTLIAALGIPNPV